MKKIVLFIVIISTLLGCSKDGDNKIVVFDREQIAKDIIGFWVDDNFYRADDEELSKYYYFEPDAIAFGVMREMDRDAYVVLYEKKVGEMRIEQRISGKGIPLEIGIGIRDVDGNIAYHYFKEINSNKIVDSDGTILYRNTGMELIDSDEINNLLVGEWVSDYYMPYYNQKITFTSDYTFFKEPGSLIGDYSIRFIDSYSGNKYTYEYHLLGLPGFSYFTFLRGDLNTLFLTFDDGPNSSYGFDDDSEIYHRQFN